VGSSNTVCGVKTATLPSLDQHDLFRRHPTYVFPLVVLALLHAIHLPVTIQVSERVRDEVPAGVNTFEVAERKWPVKRDMVDWLPEIDDLQVPLQSLHVLSRKVASHTHDSQCGHLVDMHTQHVVSILRHVNGVSGAPAADGMIEKDDVTGTGELPEQFDALRVVSTRARISSLFAKEVCLAGWWKYWNPLLSRVVSVRPQGFSTLMTWSLYSQLEVHLPVVGSALIVDHALDLSAGGVPYLRVVLTK